VGLEPVAIASIGAVVPIGEGVVQVDYRTADGINQERLLGLADKANLSVATVERPWSFDGNGEAFQLGGIGRADRRRQGRCPFGKTRCGTLYLPRLKTREALIQAIRTGAGVARLMNRQLARSRLMSTNAAAWSRTTPWSAASRW
jgi:hypothetical protein